MNNLLEYSRGIAELEKLVTDLNKGLSNLFAYGVSDSQRAYLIAALKQMKGFPMLVVTADSLEAKKLTDDLSFFLGSEKVALFPTSTVIPYETAAMSHEATAQRLKVIDMLLAKQNMVVVAPVQALFSKLIPPEIVKKFTLYFEVGKRIPLDEVATSLTAMGYERVTIIEGRGQFAVRGGILDIFPLTREYPIRMEFFDDEVDSIREFSPEDQRSMNKLDSISIGAAREIIYDEKTAKKAAQKIRDELEQRLQVLNSLGKETLALHLSEKIEEHIEKLNNGIFFESADLYTSYFYSDLSTLMDYFGKQFLAVLIEPERILEAQKNAAFETEDTYKGLLERGEILASQANVYYSPFEILEKLKEAKVVYMSMLPKICNEFEPGGLYSFQFRSVTPMYGKVDLLQDEINRLKRKGYRIVLLSGTKDRGEHLSKILRENNVEVTFHKECPKSLSSGQVIVIAGTLTRGFEAPVIRLAIISDLEIYGAPKRKQKIIRKSLRGKKIESYQDLTVGDYVVHSAHGIGKYLGVKSLDVDGYKKDYFTIAYSGGDTLYVPTDQVELIQKYIGVGDKPPRLNKLGGTEWKKAKKKVKDSVKEMAQELIKLYASRQTVKGFAFSEDTPWQKEFEDMFPYEETPDQLAAIEDVKRDLESERPMDRLLCGDVGYGKTEVALRAAFKVVMESKQVAVLVPTTILAEQHFHTFYERFAPFPVEVDVISRFKTPGQQKETLRKLKLGEIDIIIGTHRLLQKDVKFKDLGLLIIDEEQRFGVTHKEKIKQFKKNVDVLTLTATPIPRTLHMAMSGVRDISVIETPPEDRLPIQTYVVEHNESLIRDAILREISRQGQVYYVYNRVETIHEEANKLKKLIPEARIAVAHGQMKEDELEEVMINFYDHVYDVLVCTTIIETGLDIPNVNTLIVESADKMGLAQLYQLRGRVGRSNRQAFAYMTYKKDKTLSEAAEKRLSAIREFTEFGSGFKIALRDLQIRGAGNILGTQQHGHMSAVGYDLYCKLLSAAVKELKGEEKREEIQPVIELSVSAFISDKYIQDTAQKMEIYRSIAGIDSIEEAEDLEDELVDRYGDIPDETRNLIQIARIKVLARQLRISSIIQQQDVVNFKFQDEESLKPEMIFALASMFKKQVIFSGTSVPSFTLKTRGLSEIKLLLRIEKILDEMKSMHETCSVV